MNTTLLHGAGFTCFFDWAPSTSEAPPSWIGEPVAFPPHPWWRNRWDEVSMQAMVVRIVRATWNALRDARGCRRWLEGGTEEEAVWG